MSAIDKRFVVLHIGITQMQVCTDATTPEAVLGLATKQAPSGTRRGWQIDAELFEPVVCDSDATLRHWVLSC